jgi:hypothetical protein
MDFESVAAPRCSLYWALYFFMAVIKAYPGSAKVHQDEREFARLVGECITTWAFVDRQIFRLFALHLETKSKRAAIVYYRLPTLAGRLDLTDALLKNELSKRVFETKWRPICIDTRNLLAVRAVIAHQPPIRTGTGRGQKAIYLFSIHVEPDELEVKSFEKLRGKKSLGMKDLREHTNQVEKIVERLQTFSAVLANRKSRGRRAD